MNWVFLLFIAASLVIGPTSSRPADCDKHNPCPLQGGNLLPRCPELVSDNGELKINLSVEIGYFKFDWLELPRRSYNGLKCPFTWRVKPGDTVQVTLEPSDSVFVSVTPGQSYQYTYEIIEDHASGSYWYHAHHHGSVTLQTIGGMGGMLIVEDDPNNTPAELRAVSCPENCEHDISLIVCPMLFMDRAVYYQKTKHDSLRDSHTRIRGGGTLENWLIKNVNNYTVNGELNPIIQLQQDQLTRFRILFVGDAPPLELSVVDENGDLAPCDIREIARDGVYFDAPIVPRTGQSILYPGNRLDWLIICRDVGLYKLFTEAKTINDKAFAGYDRATSVLARIRVTERTTTSPIIEFPQILPSRPEYLSDLRDVEPDQIISVELGGNNMVNREYFSRKDYYRFKVEADSVIEIQMFSADWSFSHSMHFHVNHVQVIGFQPYTGPVAYYKFMNPIWEMREQETGELCYYQHKGYKKGDLPFNVTHPLKYKGHYARWKKGGIGTLPYHLAGQWMDTYFSPGMSNMTLRMRTDRFTGPLLVHCHMPSDSDMGMKMVIEIVEKGGDTSGANILSGNAAPGSCRKCDWNRYQDTPPECDNA